MSQVINTNVASLNAQRNLQMSQTTLSTSLQRLSSGLRINSAKDDAAGLAISDRFTTQIRGINQAVRNANDGISLAQVGESALAEVTSNLQRIRELAVQSANATNSDSDRRALDLEVQQRLAEIDRIAGQTSFNGRKILDGSFGNAAFQIGANVGETINVGLSTSMRQADIGAIATATSVDLSTIVSPEETVTGIVLADGDITIDGESVAAGTYATAADLASAINDAYVAAGGTGTIAAANGNVIEFTNATGDAIAIEDANDVLGLGTSASVDAQTVSAATDTIDAAVFDKVEITDLVIDGNTVAAGVYTATELAAAINDLGIANLTATENAGAVELVFSDGTNTIDITGTDASLFDNSTIGNGTDGTVASSNFDSVEISDLTIAVDGGTAEVVPAGVYTQADLITALNTAFTAAGGDGTLAADDTAGGIDLDADDTASNVVVFGGTTDTAALSLDSLNAATDGTASSDDLETALAAETTIPAVELEITDLTIQLGDSDAVTVAAGTYTSQTELLNAINTALGGNATASIDAETNVLSFTSGENITIGGADAATVFTATEIEAGGSLETVNVLTAANSNDAIQRIDAALTSVSELRSTFGALQNRFESTIANLQASSENLSASRSRILDADFAAETANLTRAQILQQAGVAMLAQANALPQNVLSLLR